VLDFDEETARRLVAVYTTPDVVDQRRAIRAAVALQPGEQVLDIGSGPGFLAAKMAEEVGVDARVWDRPERQHARDRPPWRDAGRLRPR